MLYLYPPTFKIVPSNFITLRKYFILPSVQPF